jgi:hypothetical protein
MATIKITSLGHLSNADIAPGDVFVIDHISTPITNKLTVANLTSYISTTLGNLDTFASYANTNAATLSSAIYAIQTGNTTFSGNKTFSNSTYFADGSISTPAIAFASQVSTGFYKPSSGIITMVSAGTAVTSFEGFSGVKTRGSYAMAASLTTGSSDVILSRDGAAQLGLRNGINPQQFSIYNTYTDASNYERGKLAWSSNTFEIGTEAVGSGTRRNIKLNYTTTIDGNSLTNTAALNIINVGAGTGGLYVGALGIGHKQDNSRMTGFDVPNKALLYSIRGSAVSSQGAHRFSGDNNTGTSVGANGSIVDILAPSTATNILQGRKADETVVFNVGYDGSVTIAGNVNLNNANSSISFSGYSISERVTNNVSSVGSDVFSMPIASKHFAKLLINVEDLTYGQYQTSELLLIHDGTDSKLTEYGIVFTSTNPLVSYDSYMDANNVVLRATASSSDNRIRVLQITA